MIDDIADVGYLPVQGGRGFHVRIMRTGQRHKFLVRDYTPREMHSVYRWILGQDEPLSIMKDRTLDIWDPMYRAGEAGRHPVNWSIE